MEPVMLSHTRETTSMKKTRNEKGKMINQYLILKNIGEGSTCKVKLIENLETKQIYAMKCFNKTILKKRMKLIRLPDGTSSYKTGLDDVRKEINIMKKLNHPNVIKLIEVIDDISFDSLYIILEYAENGELMIWDEDKQVFKHSINENKYLDEAFLRNIIRDMLKALHYIHSLGVLHRDIKPLNIMLFANNSAKLGDFGSAIEVNQKECKIRGSEGTFHFMAPECLKSDGNEDGFFDGRLGDIWSLGVSLYSMAFLKLPFFDFSLVQLIEDIRTKDLVFPKSRTISDELKDLIIKMLTKDPHQRITLKEIIESNWINKGLSKLTDEILI